MPSPRGEPSFFVDDFFQAADLAGAEIVVEDDDVGLFFLRQMGDFDRLAAADVCAGVDFLAALQNLTDDFRSGGFCQRSQLAQRIARIGRGIWKDHSHEHRPLLPDGQLGSFQFGQMLLPQSHGNYSVTKRKKRGAAPGGIRM